MIDDSGNIDVMDLTPIRDIISREAGIHFEENKFYFLERRVARRIKATNSSCAKEYYRLLTLGNSAEELHHLIVAVTTNETYFYRNQPQLESFQNEALQMIAEEKRKAGDYSLKLWSAGCSSGEEPYTLAIQLKEALPDFFRWKIEILATDIDTEVLDKARMGLYEARAVKDVTPQLLKQYFQESNGSYEVSPEIKEMVTFRQLNLLDRQAMRMQMDYDFIFCRNVLIYFRDEHRKQAVNWFYDSLRPGGFIFLGHSESVGKLSAAFQLVKLNKALSYRK